MSQSNNNNENSLVRGIDSLIYLVVTRFLIVLLPFIAIVVVVRYQAVQSVDCGGRGNTSEDGFKIFVGGFTVFFSDNGQLSLFDSSSSSTPASCIGANLSGRNLRGSYLNYANLTESDLQYSDLSKAQLRWADLSGANMAGVNLQGADLRNAKLVGANLTGADLRNTLLDDTDLRGANLSRSDLTRVDLTTTKLAGVNFNEAKLVEVDLHGVNLPGISLTRANLTGANINGMNLNGTSISGANFSGVSAIKTQFSGVWANLTNLTGANLTEASLAGTLLIGSNLTSAKLAQANMVGAVLIGSRLNGADLSGANINGSHLFLAELDESLLQGDPLLSSLNELQRGQIIKNADLSGITFDSNTIWPAGKATLLASILGPRFTNIMKNPNKKEALTEKTLTSTDMGRIRLPMVQLTPQMTGTIFMNGSSTVYPLSNAIGGVFMTYGFSGSIKIGELGTGEGFKLFCEHNSENVVDIVNASRPINESELASCSKNGLKPFAFIVALDALAIVINPTNENVNNLTQAQLPVLFKAEQWSNLDPTWPPNTILRFTDVPGSGADFIVDKILDGQSNALINAPNIIFGTSSNIILGVASNQYALGFVGYSYYKQNSETMKIVSIDNILPSIDTVTNGKTYPLVRPLYIYTDASILQQKPELRAFLSFYLTYVDTVIKEVGYFPIPVSVMDQQEYKLLTILNFGVEN